MQLILEAEPSGDIKINMATQIETTVNGDISDLKKDICQTNIESSMNENDETVSKSENTVMIKAVTEIDRQVSKNIIETVLREENSQVNNSNGNENLKDNLELIEKEDSVIDAINMLVNENTITVNNRTLNEDESENGNRNLEEQFKNVGSIANDLDLGTEMITSNNDIAAPVIADSNAVLEKEVSVDNSLIKDEHESEDIKTHNNLNATNEEPQHTSIDFELDDKCETQVDKTEATIESQPETASTKSISTQDESSIQPTITKETIKTDNVKKVASLEDTNELCINENKNTTCKIATNESVPGLEGKDVSVLNINEPEDIVMNEIRNIPMVDAPTLNNAEELIAENNPASAKDASSAETEKLTCVLTDSENNVPSNDTNAMGDDVGKSSAVLTCVVDDKANKLIESKTVEKNEIKPICDIQTNNIEMFDEESRAADKMTTSLEPPSLEDTKSNIVNESTPILSVDKSVKCISATNTISSESSNSSTTMKENVNVSMGDLTATSPSGKTVDNVCHVVNSVEDSEKKESIVVDTTTNSEKEIEIEDFVMEIDDVEVVDLDSEKVCEDSSIANSNDISSNKTATTVRDITENMKNENTSNNASIEKSKNENAKDRAKTPVENASETEIPTDRNVKNVIAENQDKVEIVDEDDIRIIENKPDKTSSNIQEKDKSSHSHETKTLPVVCKLSNTLDILSDDEDEPSKVDENKQTDSPAERQCINIDDDDDIMLIDEDSNPKEPEIENDKTKDLKDETHSKPNNRIDLETGEKETTETDICELSPKINEKDSSEIELIQDEKIHEMESKKSEKIKPLLPDNFLKTAKKNLADMTRDELEDFCILKIVEGIVDRSNLSDIKTKMKTMAQNIEEYRKKAMMLTKQNRDLQVVLKSVQEEQKKRTNIAIQPLKITRSVGMQVLMTDKLDARRKGPIPIQQASNPVGKTVRGVPPAMKNMKSVPVPVNIPIPRLVPAHTPAKAATISPVNSVGKTASPNGLRNPSPLQKGPEKRPHSRLVGTSSVTVDLTDDEPPAKVAVKPTAVPPVRLVPPQNLMAQQRPSGSTVCSPRKVYIPISGQQAQSIRPGQTVLLKGVPATGPRPRLSSAPPARMTPVAGRQNRQPGNRHPAPLPEVVKQYTPPTWKPIPPAPDLKLSKVENGIVISWKIDGYPENGCEIIASYQLYAYQETSSPPSTSLWKKIGDVKALPLPMACTLTQFMAGFKYYFAVRAVDIRSRLGPFSLPGSILLLNKV